MELGPGSPCVAPPTPLTSHRFPGGRGSNTHPLMARPGSSPARQRPGGGRRASHPDTAPPLTSAPAANRGRHVPPASNPGRATGRHAAEGRKWRAVAGQWRPGAVSPGPAAGAVGLAEPLLGLRVGEGSWLCPRCGPAPLASQPPPLRSLLPFFRLKQPLEPGGVARGAEPVGVVEMVPSNAEGGHRGSRLSSTGHPGRDLMTDAKQVREKATARAEGRERSDQG